MMPFVVATLFVVTLALQPEVPERSATGAARLYRAQAGGDAAEIRLNGVLERGVECWLVRSEANMLYSIGPTLPAGLASGDAVRVVGTRTGVSFCMQGIPLRVQSIERAN